LKFRLFCVLPSVENVNGSIATHVDAANVSLDDVVKLMSSFGKVVKLATCKRKIGK
jgi:hypothetical protein